MTRLNLVAATLLTVLSTSTVLAADPPATFDRKQDVIYGRLPGIALTMDVFAPKSDAATKPNGRGIIWVVSGGWASSHEAIDGLLKSPFGGGSFILPLTDRGYTVFAVVHGSQPKFTITEILPQLNRAVRYIRFHAKDYGIDPDKLGIMGASAGGHLSLMQGLSPEPTNATAREAVDQVSSRVRAVVAFVPPTDFLNYGGPGVVALGKGPLEWLKAPFDFHDPKFVPSSLTQQQLVYEKVTDEKRLEVIGKQISPIYHIDKDDAAIFVLHGEVDRLVPVQQAKSLKEKLDDAKVANELFIRPGADHGWLEMTGEDMQKVLGWFDTQLK